MIQQLAILVPPSTPGRAGQGAVAASGADDTPLALVFGDLLGAMATEPVPVALQQQGSDAAAGFLTPPLGLGSTVGDGVAADAGEAEPVASVNGLWVLLAQAGLADVDTATGGGRAATNIPAPVAAPVEPRLPLPPLLTPTAGDAVLVSSAPVSAPEILQGLASSVGQPAVTEAAGGGALASVLQAPPGERLEAAAARPAVALPLPSQEARATFTQTLDQVVWMTREGVHQARLQLEPAHLGRVDIWLDLDGGEAKLHLGAQQAQVREALEAVLPRLRDALAQHGMSLTDASVSDSGREQPEYSDSRASAAPTATGVADTDAVDGGEPPPGSGLASGLLDLYA